METRYDSFVSYVFRNLHRQYINGCIWICHKLWLFNSNNNNKRSSSNVWAELEYITPYILAGIAIWNCSIILLRVCVWRNGPCEMIIIIDINTIDILSALIVKSYVCVSQKPHSGLQRGHANQHCSLSWKYAISWYFLGYCVSMFGMWYFILHISTNRFIR